MAESFEPEHFNPAIEMTSGVRFIAANVMPRIVRLSLALEVLPALALTWDISEDGLTYTFHLDPRARWEDGVPITAHDVAYTWNEIIPEYHIQGAALSQNWKEVRASDDFTVVLELTNPEPTFLTTADQLGILPKHRYEGTDFLDNPLNWEPLSGGPFKFNNYVRGDHVELVRNEDYWVEGLPYLDRIVIRYIEDATARLAALEAGDVDYTFGYISVPEAKRIADQNPNIVMMMGGHWGNASISSCLGFNLRREPVNNVLVRQAIAHAIDKDFIFQTVTLGLGRIANSHFGSGNWAHTDDVPVYEYDPEKAEALLDEAGLPRGADGIRFSMEMHAAGNQAEHLKILEILVDHLGQIGIEVVPAPNEKQAFEQLVFFDWEFDSAFRGIATGVNPTSHAVWRAYHSTNIVKERIKNNWGYSNPRVDELFDTAAVQPTREDMLPLLHEIQVILMTELPSIPILERFEPYLWNQDYQNVVDYTGDFSRTWWVNGEPSR